MKKRISQLLAVALSGFMLATFISACGGADKMDGGQKGRSDFYQDGYEPGSGYPYTKPKSK